MNYLPISQINHLVYCPRRFWYMWVQGELAINAPMLEGSLQHKRADTPGKETDDNGRNVNRRIWVWNDDLNIAGFADFVEENGNGDIIPVEYKHGRRAQWDNDQIQLCAQALCLEQMLGITVTTGEIFYRKTRRRLTVPFDDALRTQTKEAITAAHHIMTNHTIPAPITERKKCKHCSIQPICLPDETTQLQQNGGQTNPF